MSGEKFHLDLTGRPLEGYRTEEVAAALARLLRIPRKRARNLLRGTPSRIQRAFEKEKAVHLMSKILACGAQCEITPGGTQDDDRQGIAANIELSEKLELEIDQPEMQPASTPAEVQGQSKIEAVRGDHRPQMQTAPHAGEEVPDGVSADGESGGQRAHSGSARATGGGVAGTSESTGGGRKKVLSFAAAAVLLLGFAIWAGLNHREDGPGPVRQKEAAGEAPTHEAAPATLSALAKTRQRLELLARSVKIWMIQYGAGFDPSQVTMDRMQQDLGISPAEMEDGWGTPFRFSTAAESYTITSAGPDRVFDSKDDVKAEKSSR